MPRPTWYSLAFLLGLALTGLLRAQWPVELYLFAAVVSLSALFLWRDRQGLFLCLCGIFFLLGAARYQSASAFARDGLTRYHTAGTVSVQGIVSEPPDVRDSYSSLRIEVKRIRKGGEPCSGSCNWIEVDGSVLARLPRFAGYAYGDELEMSGVLRTPPVLPGFSYRDYLARQDIYSLLERPRTKLLAVGQGAPLPSALYALREQAHEVINRSVPEPQASLLSGILLGLERGIPRKLSDDFNRTGTSHIIAISGYNFLLLVGFIAAGSALFVRRRHSWLPILLLTLAYAAFVGGSPSVVRAVVMALLVVLGPVAGRPTLALHSLALAALAMTALTPSVIFDVGFQLSFAATLAILVLARPLNAAFSDRLNRQVPNARRRELLSLVGGDLTTTVAATLATLPIIVYNFQRVSLISLPVNLLVLPAQPLVMATGLLTVAGGLIHPVLGQLFGWLAWPFLSWTAAVVEWAAALPIASSTVAMPGWAVVAYYVLLLGGTAYWLRQKAAADADTDAIQPAVARVSAAERRTRWALGIAALVVMLVWAAGLSQSEGLLSITFVDVGQGQATLIRTPSGQMSVIDGGPGASALLDALGRRLPFYEHDVALAVLTRSSDENLVGLVSLLERYRVGRVLAPPDAARTFAGMRWRELIVQQSISQTVPLDGLQFALGDGVQLEVVSTGKDDEGLSLRLSYGYFNLYFEGGAAGVSADFPATILHVARHGDKQAASQALLDALTPSFAIISVDSGRSSTPNSDTLIRLEESGAAIYRTDLNGSITFLSDGQRLWVETER